MPTESLQKPFEKTSACYVLRIRFANAPNNLYKFIMQLPETKTTNRNSETVL